MDPAEPPPALRALVATRGLAGERGRYVIDRTARPGLAYVLLTRLRSGDHALEVAIRVELDALQGVSLEAAPGDAWFGRDYRVGESPFDDRFVVSGDTPYLLPLWLEPAVRSALVHAYSPHSPLPCRLLIRQGAATVRVAVWPDDSGAIEAALAVLDAVVRIADELVERWRGLAAGLGSAHLAGPRWPLAANARMLVETSETGAVVRWSWDASGPTTGVELPDGAAVTLPELVADPRRIQEAIASMRRRMPEARDDSSRLPPALARHAAKRGFAGAGDGDGDGKGGWTAAGVVYRMEVRTSPSTAIVHNLTVHLEAAITQLGDTRFEVKPAPAWSALIRRDHEVGDRTFDSHFVIHSRAPDRLAIWLDPPVRDQLLATLSPINPYQARLAVGDGVARIRAALADTDAAGGGALIGVLEAIAGVPGRWAARWQALATALAAPRVDTTWPFDTATLRLDRAGGEVTIAWRLAPRLRTELRARHRNDPDTFAARAAAARADLPGGGNITIEGGDVVADLHGLVEDAGRLVAVADRVLALAEPVVAATGPYR